MLLKSIPVIVLSSGAAQGDIDKAYSIGACCYVEAHGFLDFRTNLQVRSHASGWVPQAFPWTPKGLLIANKSQAPGILVVCDLLRFSESLIPPFYLPKSPP